LPMLLQLPIFFALYQVFATSIELYRAPFGLWIHDLSFKDPYFVLPVAMAVVMFFQQWVTPSTMDPQQKKVMMFMPLLFSVFMLNLPSGLSLYMFVSGLFGVLQQLYFMRDTSASAVTKLEIV
jgi:YidC/Oxa1 family membrane protein insertase